MASIVGHHVILDAIVRDSSILARVESLQPFFERSVQAANLSVLNRQFKQFHPFGATGLYLLSESHVSFHTWPEHNLICVDVFTCSTENKAERFANTLINELRPIKVKKTQVLRGEVTEAASMAVVRKVASWKT